MSPSGGLGGAERVLLTLLEGMHRRGHEVGLLSAEPGPLLQRAQACGSADVLPFPVRLGALGESGRGAAGVLLDLPRVAAPVARYLRRLQAVGRDWSPDIVHTNGVKAHILAAWARLPGVLLWHLHEYVSARGVSSRLLRASGGRAGGAIAVSTSVAADFTRAVPGVRVWTVPNAVDIALFKPSGPVVDLDMLAGLPPSQPGTVRVGLVGTYAWWKGHDIFLQALARISPALPVRGYIVGGPVYSTGAASQMSTEALVGRIAGLGLSGRVGLTGFIEDVPSVMRSLDVVVHASTEREPFGLVIAEGMACGRPVVVSAAGGAAEIVRSGEDALAYAPGDAGALATILTGLAADAPLRSALGTAARRAAEERFDSERLISGVENVYREAKACAPSIQ